jgi:hypothetical protein
LPKRAGPKKPDCNRHGPVASGLARSFAVAQPVATCFRLRPVATSLYRFNTGCNQFFEVKFIKYHGFSRSILFNTMFFEVKFIKYYYTMYMYLGDKDIH